CNCMLQGLSSVSDGLARTKAQECNNLNSNAIFAAPDTWYNFDDSKDENIEVVFTAKLDQLKIAETVKMCRKEASARAKRSANVLNKKIKKMSSPSRQNHTRSSDRFKYQDTSITRNLATFSFR
ncbi:hypothetical protein Tco_0943760, partial [Tanacetum coccineum]